MTPVDQVRLLDHWIQEREMFLLQYNSTGQLYKILNYFLIIFFVVKYHVNHVFIQPPPNQYPNFTENATLK